MLPPSPGARLRVTPGSDPVSYRRNCSEWGKAAKGRAGTPGCPSQPCPQHGASTSLRAAPAVRRAPSPLHHFIFASHPSFRFFPSFLSPHPALPPSGGLSGSPILSPLASETHREAPRPDVGWGVWEGGNTGATQGKVWISPGAVLAGGHRVDSSEPYRGGVRFPSILQSAAAASLLPRPHRSERSGSGLPRLPAPPPGSPRSAPAAPSAVLRRPAPLPALRPHRGRFLSFSLGAFRSSAGCPLPPRTPSPATAPASPVPCHRLEQLRHEHGPVQPNASFVSLSGARLAADK